MNRIALSVLPFALVVLIAVPAFTGGGDRIDVMTQNQYLGANLTPIIAAPDPLAFNAAVLDALSDIASNDFPTRAGLLARLITGRLPELVGLQEVFSFSCLPIAPPPASGGCDDATIAGAFNEHLPLTLSAISGMGESYVAVAQVENLNIQIPVDTDGNFQPDILVTVIDRDVVLARSDIAAGASPVDFSPFCPGRASVDGCNYQVVAEAATAVGPIRQERGWVGVDVNVAGRDYRFVNTHLEVQNPDPSNPLAPFIQAAQSAELIGILAATTPPGRSLLVVGDINSSPDDMIIPGPFPLPPPFDQGIVPPYAQLVGQGYSDAWTLKGGAPGFTCCQLDDLSNHQSALDERIDVIFSRDVPEKSKKNRVLGENIPDKSAPGGLWPSDHGSVATELEFWGVAAAISQFAACTANATSVIAVEVQVEAAWLAPFSRTPATASRTWR